MANINVRGDDGKEIGWAEGRNGMSQVYGLSLYMNNESGRVTMETVNSKGLLTRGGMSVEKSHWLRITTEFLGKLGYKVRKKADEETQAYLNAPADCPFCHTQMSVASDPIDAINMSGEAWCAACDKTWIDCYELVGLIETD